MTASNGQQEAARLERAVNTFVDRLRATPPDLLTRAPADGEWNARQLAAHEAEICAYWAQQLAYLKTHPGQPFGRTAEDADRIKYIEDHKDDSLADLESAIRLGADQAAAALRAYTDEEWSRITGIHSRRGVMDMDFVSNLFLAGHAEEHLNQLEGTLAAANQKES